MIIDALPPTISVPQAGELLGISPRSAYRAVERGEIPSLRVGRRVRVPTQRFLDLLGIGGRSPAPSPNDVGPSRATLSTTTSMTAAFDVAELHHDVDVPFGFGDGAREAR